MAEAIGVIAAVIQILELGVTTAKKVNELADDYKKHGRHMRTLAKRVDLNNRLLEQLKGLIESDTKDGLQLSKSLREDLTTALDCFQIAVGNINKACEDVARPSRLGRAFQKVKYSTLNKESINVLYNGLNQCHEEMNLIMTIAWRSDATKMHQEVMHILREHGTELRHARVPSINAAVYTFYPPFPLLKQGTDRTTQSNKSDRAAIDNGPIRRLTDRSRRQKLIQSGNIAIACRPDEYAAANVIAHADKTVPPRETGQGANVQAKGYGSVVHDPKPRSSDGKTNGQDANNNANLKDSKELRQAHNGSSSNALVNNGKLAAPQAAPVVSEDVAEASIPDADGNLINEDGSQRDDNRDRALTPSVRQDPRYDGPVGALSIETNHKNGGEHSKNAELAKGGRDPQNNPLVPSTPSQSVLHGSKNPEHVDKQAHVESEMDSDVEPRRSTDSDGPVIRRQSVDHIPQPGARSKNGRLLLEAGDGDSKSPGKLHEKDTRVNPKHPQTRAAGATSSAEDVRVRERTPTKLSRRERECVEVRRRRRTSSPSPSPPRARSLVASERMELPPILRPPIHQEIITHHRHIRHGSVRAPTSNRSSLRTTSAAHQESGSSSTNNSVHPKARNGRWPHRKATKSTHKDGRAAKQPQWYYEDDDGDDRVLESETWTLRDEETQTWFAWRQRSIQGSTWRVSPLMMKIKDTSGYKASRGELMRSLLALEPSARKMLEQHLEERGLYLLALDYRADYRRRKWRRDDDLATAISFITTKEHHDTDDEDSSISSHRGRDRRRSRPEGAYRSKGSQACQSRFLSDRTPQDMEVAETLKMVVHGRLKNGTYTNLTQEVDSLALWSRRLRDTRRKHKRLKRVERQMARKGSWLGVAIVIQSRFQSAMDDESTCPLRMKPAIALGARAAQWVSARQQKALQPLQKEADMLVTDLYPDPTVKTQDRRLAVAARDVARSLSDHWGRPD